MTGNFGFLQAQWPELYREARNAERDGSSTPAPPASTPAALSS